MWNFGENVKSEAGRDVGLVYTAALPAGDFYHFRIG